LENPGTSGLVTGHGFSRAEKALKNDGVLTPEENLPSPQALDAACPRATAPKPTSSLHCHPERVRLRRTPPKDLRLPLLVILSESLISANQKGPCPHIVVPEPFTPARP